MNTPFLSTSQLPKRRLRVLLIAEAANPDWVSVPLVGWSHSQALARLTEAHLITQIRNRDAIIRAGLREGQDFTAIDSELLASGLFKLATRLRGGAGKGWTTLTAFSALAYYYFELLVWRQFSHRLMAGEFDLVHRLTPLSPTTPSLLAQKCHRIGVPFVIGPLNGGLPWPKNFDRERRKEKEWLSYLRFAYKLLPGYKSTRRCANTIIIGSQDTWQQMDHKYYYKCIYIPENAIDPDRFGETVTRPITLPIRIAFAGRLVPYKGADMLLQAAAPLIQAGKVTLDIIGDGPELPNLHRIADELGINHGLRMQGWVEHRRLQQKLLEADVFAFPSIREFGGGVLLEAMALGLVPIVVNYGGPGELVTDTTGYRIPIGTRFQIIKGIQEILSKIVANPDEIRPLGIQARQRVLTYFTWDAKAKQVYEVYSWVLGLRHDKPQFDMPF